mgnify:CR=1 FL=1|jgi:hypothetical protein
MADINAPYEYVVAQKSEGKWRVRRILLITLYILYPIFALLAALITRLSVPMLCFIPLSEWMLIFFTWRYVKVEYEYEIVSGVLTFSNVYGGRSRREKVSFPLRSATLIAPLDYSTYEDKLELFNPEISFYGIGSSDSPDKYFAAFTNEEGKKCVFFFEATERALKICRFYNPAATVVTKVRY